MMKTKTLGKYARHAQRQNILRKVSEDRLQDSVPLSVISVDPGHHTIEDKTMRGIMT
jgi:hypothetical protein